MIDNTLTQLKSLYELKKGEIIKRLKEFRQTWVNGNDEEIFAELSFCILTPQSKARSCWDAIVNIKKNNLLLKGITQTKSKSVDHQGVFVFQGNLRKS